MRLQILFLALVVLIAAPLGAAPLFSGPFEVTNWTFFTEGNGAVSTINEPNSITLFGSDDSCEGEECDNGSRITRFQITYNELAPILFTFSWEYVTFDDNAGFDPFGYFINETFVELTDPELGNQTGTAEVTINPGDTFGFYILSTDDCCGLAYANIPQGIPEPSTYLMMGGGLALVGLVSRRFLSR
ncbi:MAG TPA: hypothetical protein DEH78_11195 [Solibacterales bacterium]|nr:hypothetical protein [Bryobacterales bacterium]